MPQSLQKALHFAMRAHEGAERKFQEVPYVWHPISVAKLVEVYKPSRRIKELRIAAILHDTVEDTDATLEIIAHEFGLMVAQLVEELTSDKEEQNRLGKTEYLKQKMTHMSSYALVIKLCDRLDNVMDLEMVTESFRVKYMKETEEILEHLYLHRKLTDTHKKIMSKIGDELEELLEIDSENEAVH